MLHILGAVRNRREMVGVFLSKEMIPVLPQVNDARLGAGRHVCRVRGHLGDRPLLPGKYVVTYPLELGNAFSY